MAFEVITASEGSLIVRDTVTERVWQFLIVAQEGGFRELSDTFQAGLDKDAMKPGIGDEVPVFEFATREALVRGLID